MSVEAVYKLGAAFLAVQMLIVLIPLYSTFRASRADASKRYLFFAFLAYMLFLVFHSQEYLVKAKLLEDVLFWQGLILDHLFKTMFFLFYGYALLDVYVSDKVLRKINRANLAIASSVLAAYTAILMLEGKGAIFYGGAKEMVYSVVTLVALFLIVNLLYHSYIEVRSRHLLVNGFAFTFFLMAELTHTANMLWGFSEAEFILRHVLRTFAVALVAYAVVRYRRKY